MVEQETVHNPHQEVDWGITSSVNKWLESQQIPVSEGIDCIDEREKLQSSQLILPVFEDALSLNKFTPEDGALNFPGMDVGLSLMLVKSLDIPPIEAVKYIKGFALANGRSGLHIHSDENHQEENLEEGCGVMNLLAKDARIFGLNRKEGRQLNDAVLNDTTTETEASLYVALYKGKHKPAAWVVNLSADHTFRQYDGKGTNVFLTEPTRVKKMLTDRDPKKGLVAYLHSQNEVDRSNMQPAVRALYKGYLDIVDTVAPILAGGKPLIYATVHEGLKVKSSRRGTVPVLRAA